MEILGRKGSGTMIFIVSWCYGGLAMVIIVPGGRVCEFPPVEVSRGGPRSAEVSQGGPR